MDLSAHGKGDKGKKGKGDKKGKGKGNSKKGEDNKDEKDKDKGKKGKGKDKNNAKAAEYFAGNCLHCKGWGHMKKDCWWNANAKNGKDTASLENSDTPAADATEEPSITGMLIQSDESEAVPDSMTKRVYVHNDFLIDSGAATSVSQQSLVDSLGGAPRGPGVELRSATGHEFTTTGNTTICLGTRDGINVSGDFQNAPKDTGKQRSIISVGQDVRQRQYLHVPQYRWDDTQRIYWQSN